jgi:hypothetical protein
MRSYASFRAAAAELEKLSAKYERAKAKVQATLPFLGDDIFVLIVAELDTRMIGRLACAAQRFWRPSVPDPAHQGTAPAELWSVAEEGARRRLAAQGEQVRGWVSRGGVGGSWLRALGEAEKLQRPLRWTAHHEEVVLGEEGTAAWQNVSVDYSSAVCGAHEMRRGRHYATFTLRTYSRIHACLGVVGVGFDPTGPDDGGDADASNAPHGWMLFTGNGYLFNAGRMSEWEGQPQLEELEEGDVVVRLHPFALLRMRLTLLCATQGMLLDCDTATLTVWVNGERKGVAVRPGMTNLDGDPVPRLEGPLRWAVDLSSCASVLIEGPLPPPAIALPEDTFIAFFQQLTDDEADTRWSSDERPSRAKKQFGWNYICLRAFWSVVKETASDVVAHDKVMERSEELFPKSYAKVGKTEWNKNVTQRKWCDKGKNYTVDKMKAVFSNLYKQEQLMEDMQHTVPV